MIGGHCGGACLPTHVLVTGEVGGVGGNVPKDGGEDSLVETPKRSSQQNE
jgi:hypothetical protein